METSDQQLEALDAQEQIKRFIEYIDEYQKEQLLERIQQQDKFLIIDFTQLTMFSPDLAQVLLEQPEEVIKAAEIAIEHFDTLGDVRGFRARFMNVPESHKLMIRELRAIHLNKFLLVEGTVRQKSDVRPQVISAKFECPSCGNVLNVLQLDTKFREPARCGCGRKGKFRLLDKEMVDAQGIVLEEATTDLDGGETTKTNKLAAQK